MKINKQNNENIEKNTMKTFDFKDSEYNIFE